MDQKLVALSFYRTIETTLKTEGVTAIILTLGADGEIEAHVRMGAE